MTGKDEPENGIPVIFLNENFHRKPEIPENFPPEKFSGISSFRRKIFWNFLLPVKI